MHSDASKREQKLIENRSAPPIQALAEYYNVHLISVQGSWIRARSQEVHSFL
jgi:hypothetical protein